jgi:hypothetical protein
MVMIAKTVTVTLVTTAGKMMPTTVTMNFTMMAIVASLNDCFHTKFMLCLISFRVLFQ